jgi:uracil-DNA glycosylase
MVADTLLVQSSFWDLLPTDWQKHLEIQDLNNIETQIGDNFQPSAERIFAAFQIPIKDVKVLIVGQDPYPNPDHAMGLAFSVPSTVLKLPPSLLNIFKELNSDLGINRSNGDLSDWNNQGVMLLNRTLTIGKSGIESHLGLGWEIFTAKVIKILAERGVKAILWGKQAQTFEKLFPDSNFISSAHPSPLSAYRGFFGSKPFSSINEMLEKEMLSPIKW